MVLDAEAVESLLDRYDEAGDEGLALVGTLLEFVDDVFVALRFEVFEGDVLQFALDRVETQLVGDLCVEVHRLPALFAPLFAGEDPERAHHLKAVGQLDEDHAGIFGVADDQIAEVVGLLLGDLQFEFRDVGQPHGDSDDLVAESALDVAGQGEELLVGELLVCDAHHVVQDRREGRIPSEADLGDDDLGHGDAMSDEGRAVVAGQAVEFGLGILERFVDQTLGLFREVGPHQGAEIFVA